MAINIILKLCWLYAFYIEASDGVPETAGGEPATLTELEKMAAKELQHIIDDGKQTWELQAHLTLLLQRYMEETEQVVRRKVDQIRNIARKGTEK